MATKENILRQFHSKQKYFTVILLFSTYLATSGWTAVVGPTMPDLRIRIKSSYEYLGLLLSARYVATLCSSLTMGYINDRLKNRNQVLLTISFYVIIGALGTLVIPWCRHEMSLLACFVAQGIATCGMTNGIQTSVLRAFEKQAGMAMQLTHLGYGVGFTINSLLVSQFLSKKLPRREGQLCQTKNAMFAGANENDSAVSYIDDPLSTTQVTPKNQIYDFNEQIYLENSRIEWAYAIVSWWSLLMAIIIILFYVISKEASELYSKGTPLNLQDLANKQEEVKTFYGTKKRCAGLSLDLVSPHRPVFGILFMIGIYCFYFSFISLTGFNTYVVPYAIEHCGKAYRMSQKQAAYLTSVGAASFSIARILAIIFMARRSIWFLFMCCSGVFLSCLGFSLLAPHFELALWISFCSMKFFLGPLYPAGTAWANVYIHVTSSVVSLAVMGSSSGSIVSVFVTGALFDHFGPTITGYWILALSCFLIFVVSVLTLAAVRMGERHIVIETHIDAEKGTLHEEESKPLSTSST